MPSGKDLHTSVFVWLIKREEKAFRPRTIADLVVNPPGKGLRTVIHPTLGLEIADEDYEEEPQSAVKRLAIQLLHFLLPLRDPNARWKSPEAATEALEQEFEDMYSSKNTTFQGAMLGVLTNLRMPQIIEGFAHLVLEDASGIVEEFQSRDLDALRTEINRRNEARRQDLLTFHPDYLELSVSI